MDSSKYSIVMGFLKGRLSLRLFQRNNWAKWQEKIEKEIIPRLKEEIEKLKEKFLKPRGKEVEEPIQV